MAGAGIGLEDAGHARRLPALSENGTRLWITVLLSIAIGAAVLVAYYPIRSFPFLPGIDDNGYVYENPHVMGPLNWQAVRWAFTHSFLLNYDPLTFLAHSVNVHLFGLNAGRHHDVNLLLHIINSLLLFWVLTRSTGYTARSFMVAALFALHPINVENVAWIAELKTLLSTTFFFLALGVYVSYARTPRLWRMLMVSALYLCGLFTKPQVITLPFVLLLWDYWPLGRVNAKLSAGPQLASPLRKLWPLVYEKSLLYVFAAADAVVTMLAANKPWLEQYTFLIRFGTAIRSYAVYLAKAFWPVKLAFDYPHPGYSLRWVEVAAALALLLLVTAVAVLQRRQGYLLVGWLWFCGTMLPTSNLVQIDRAPFADRYAYICFVGLFLMLTWGVAELARQLSLPRAVLPVVSVVVLVALGITTRHQVAYWSDAVTVWQHTVSLYHTWSAEHELSVLLVQRGELEQALTLDYSALKQKPRDPGLIFDLARIEYQRRNFGQAILLYQRTLPLSGTPETRAKIFAAMGHIYGEVGDTAKALECYRESKRLRAASSSAQP